jgi:hypothetical protein
LARALAGLALFGLASALLPACTGSSPQIGGPDGSVTDSRTGADVHRRDGAGDLSLVGDAGDVSVTDLSAVSTVVPAGGTLILTVTVSGPAPPGGTPIALTSSAPDKAQVAAQIVIPEGHSRAAVPVIGAVPGMATITASHNGEKSLDVTVIFGAGSLAISEIRPIAQGTAGEFIEIYNRLTIPVTLDGWTLKNSSSAAQTIRARDGGPLMLMPDSFLACVPAGTAKGTEPAGALCEWGDAGSAFDIADGGDAITLQDDIGTDIDTVNFFNVITAPDVVPAPDAFVVVPGRSMQFDGDLRPDTQQNDDPASWCTAFRKPETAGGPNEKCQQVVINEVVYDSAGSDGSKEFIELAGPGGAAISAFTIRSVNGGTGDSQNLVTVPQGTRIPGSGFYVIADGAAGSTQVPGASFITSLGIRNANGSLQLLSPTGSLVDVVGYGTITQNTDRQKNLPTLEGFAVMAPTSSDTWGFSLARDPSSTDSGNNSVDFHVDPTPTPGAANDAVNPLITAITPGDGPASGLTTIVVQGQDFIVGATLDVGTGTAAPCTVISPTQATCSVGPRAAGAGTVDASLTNGFGGGSTQLHNGFTFSTDVNPGNGAVERCQVESPPSINIPTGATVEITARIGLTGVTDGVGRGPGIRVEVGTGPRTQDPRQSGTWTWQSTTFNADSDPDDLYVANVTFAQPGTFAYAARASTDGGISWVYCDLAPGAADGFATSSAGVARIGQ